MTEIVRALKISKVNSGDVDRVVETPEAYKAHLEIPPYGIRFGGRQVNIVAGRDMRADGTTKVEAYVGKRGPSKE